MKKIALAAGFALAATLVGCNESTSSAPTTDGSTLTGVAAFRSGTASALDEDSSVLGTAPIDTNGSFEIKLPEGVEPTFVRCDSAGHKLLGFVPRGRHHVRVDSATHAILDSLREAHRPVIALDSATWDSLRTLRDGRWPEGPRDSGLVRPEGPDDDSLEGPDSIRVRPLPDSLVRPLFDSLKVRVDSLVKPEIDSAL